MHLTQVTAAVRNPAHPEKSWEGLFLVDTGAVDCLVPGRIEVDPRSQRLKRLPTVRLKSMRQKK